jgi:hypothetical protein
VMGMMGSLGAMGGISFLFLFHFLLRGDWF